MIEPTDEMVQAFDRAFEEAIEDDGFYTKEDRRIRLDAGLAAVLALVERDYRIEPMPPWEQGSTVHLATRGDAHMHCCGRELLDLPRYDRWQFDPHGITCKGPHT